MEAIKLISGLGEPLAGRMLRYDLRDMSFQTFEMERLQDCPECGTLP